MEYFLLHGTHFVTLSSELGWTKGWGKECNLRWKIEYGLNGSSFMNVFHKHLEFIDSNCLVLKVCNSNLIFKYFNSLKGSEGRGGEEWASSRPSLSI